MDTSKFPSWFLEYLNANSIPIDEYLVEIPRYIRIMNPELLKEITIILGHEPKKHWFKDFFTLPRSVTINSSKMGESYYGMDVSSAIACNALSIEPNDNILDLCCAPGAKARYMASFLNGMGTITGVDLSPHRLSIAKSVLQKHRFDRFRLYLADGQIFDVHPPHRVGNKTVFLPEPSFKKSKVEEIKPYHCTRLLRNQLSYPTYFYDKVIVDTECTHDGSIHSLLKCVENGWQDLRDQFHDPSKLRSLQQNLLENGYRLCKTGGILIYSTCSFSEQQNESIIEWFLEKYPNAILEKVPDIEDKYKAKLHSKNPALAECIRFSPIQSNTSGFFIARIRKP